MPDTKTQLAVIGAGPGGYAAAFHAADLGMEVTLIDPEPNPGGVCLFRGCIPSKALLHAARVINESREASLIGLKFTAPQIDLNRLRSWKQEVVEKLTGGVGTLGKSRGVKHVRATAAFLDTGMLELTDGRGGKSRLTFDHAILATGSTPSRIPGIPYDSKRVLDSTSALDLPDIPKTLLIIGGGYIGLELGTVYAALGSKVSVVEMTGGLLPGVDRDLVRPLAKRLESIFEVIALNTTVTGVTEQKSGLKVSFDGERKGDLRKQFDRILVSVGRKPNSQELGLDKTRIQTDKRGFIQIDPQRRTAEPNIFAIGDVAGEPMLAHKASHEGRVAVDVIAGSKAVFEPRAIPAVVFTDPEIAWCGLTEEEAKRAGRKVQVARFLWSASGRAMTFGRTDGLTKLVINPDTGRILGVGLCGVGAGELIAEGVLAIEMGAVADDLRFSIHPHPTLSETLMEAADLIYGESIHMFVKKAR